MPTANAWALCVCAVSMALILYTRRLTSVIPGPLAAIVVSTLLVQLFNIPVETIGSRFGEVPNHLPSPALPQISWKLMTEMFKPALAIALLGAIESLLSAVVADGMTGRRHRSDMELVAQGLANIASPLFGGIPATGAIARTATNIKSGATSPVAGMVHSLTLLAIMLVFGRMAAWIPLAALAAVLVVVAYNMSELHVFIRLCRGEKGDIAVLLTTFFLTVFVDLIAGIEVGVILAVFLFMRRMANVSTAQRITNELLQQKHAEDEAYDPQSLIHKTIPEGVEVFEIYGPFFFGAADKFNESLRTMGTVSRVVILRMRFVPTIDATGIHVLEDVLLRSQRSGTVLLLSGVSLQLRRILETSSVLAQIAQRNFSPDIDSALIRAHEILAEKAGSSGRNPTVVAQTAEQLSQY